MKVGCVGPRLLEGDLCVELLLSIDFAPSCSEVMEKATSVGVSNVFLFQLFDVLGIEGGED